MGGGGAGNWVNSCWMCAASLLEPQPGFATPDVICQLKFEENFPFLMKIHHFFLNAVHCS